MDTSHTHFQARQVAIDTLNATGYFAWLTGIYAVQKGFCIKISL